MLAAYCAAKAGVAGLIRALATELRGTGVTANAVSPGSTDTPILAESARLYGLPGAGAFAAQQPLDRLLAPEEVAAALAWLAGDGSSGMTGAVVPVDGGWPCDLPASTVTLPMIRPEACPDPDLCRCRPASASRSTRDAVRGADALFGGSPPRLLRLDAAGERALAELRLGPVRSAAAGKLARRLTDTGMAPPRPPPRWQGEAREAGLAEPRLCGRSGVAPPGWHCPT